MGGAAFFVVSAGRKSEVDEQTKGSQMEDRARTFACQTFVGRGIGLAARLASTSTAYLPGQPRRSKESMLVVFSRFSSANCAGSILFISLRTSSYLAQNESLSKCPRHEGPYKGDSFYPLPEMLETRYVFSSSSFYQIC